MGPYLIISKLVCLLQQSNSPYITCPSYEIDHEFGCVPIVPLIESIVPKAASHIKGGDPQRSVERIDKFLDFFRKDKRFQVITLQKIAKGLTRRNSM